MMGLVSSSKNMVVLRLKFIDVVEPIFKTDLHASSTHTSGFWSTLLGRLLSLIRISNTY
jgi:hypothetical protein